MSQSKFIAASLVAALFSASVFATEVDLSEKAVSERTQPVGSVYIAGAEPEKKGGARAGSDVYNSFCIACHGAGVMGAPKPGNSADWQPRQAQGFDVLLKHAINGFNAMPAKGSCMDCSDDEIKGAIEHMLEGV
ncbi:c-type cytochrome [Algibacillus agarilyticus]|uniref:c-type cytochrome n=1 Tax=Algibacillus agarilyticus TaxID=2234133 RepID=UPI000DCF78CD|nr:cytochrome c5 family protein [Algibacillus agarilyticus]